MDRSRVASATAQVKIGGRPFGSAVLVTRDCMLTARHVLGGLGGSAARLTVHFPAGGMEFEAVDIPVAGDHGTDIAVLRVLCPDLDRLPEAVDVWPNEQVPDRLEAFGYPLADRTSQGVWRSFQDAGPTAGGLRQLAWIGGAGTLVGHSGCAVVDSSTCRLAGILVSGSEEGRFDRFIPTTIIRDAWESLPAPWEYAGQGVRSHFRRRVFGQQSTVHAGDLFRGRGVALSRVAEWLATENPGRPLVIIGQPGSGKSAVLGRAALRAQSSRSRGIVYHARNATAESFANDLAGFFGCGHVDGDGDLLAQSVASRLSTPTVMMIDALDEATSAYDARTIADTISDLSRLQHSHIVVATRPQTTGNKYSPGSLLNRLMVYGEASGNLVDLDREPFQDGGAIQAFVEASLMQEGAHNPGPPGCAWGGYRERPDLRLRLARVVSDRAAPNFLVAALSSMALSQHENVLDVDDPLFDPTAIPSSVGEALEKYFSLLDTASRQRTIGLLTALAHARGEGVDDSRWLAFARALGYPVSRSHIDELKTSRGADYLLQSDAEGSGSTIALFHQALVDQLLAGQSARDEALLYDLLLKEVEAAGGWGAADHYARTHTADHALSCGQLAHLVELRSFVSVAHSANLQSAVESLGHDDTPQLGRLVLDSGYRIGTLDPGDRLWHLACKAAHADNTPLKDYLLGDDSSSLVPEWAHSLGSVYQKLLGHVDPVLVLSLDRVGARDVILSGGADGTLRVWDRRGDLVTGPIAGHPGAVTAVAVGIIDGEDVMVSGTDRGTIHLWDQAGEAVGGPFDSHNGRIRALLMCRFGGQDAVVSVCSRGEVLVRNPEGHLLQRAEFRSSQPHLYHADGEPFAAGVSFYSLNVLRLSDALHQTWKVENFPKTMSALGEVGGKPAIVFTGRGNSLTLARLDGSLTRDLDVSRGVVSSISIGRLEDMDVIVAASESSRVSVWGHRGNLLAQPWAGDPGSSTVVRVGRLKRRGVVVSGGSDGSIRVWDGRAALSQDRLSLRDPITAMTAVSVGDDRIVTATASAIEWWNRHGELVDRLPAGQEGRSPVLEISRITTAAGEAVTLVFRQDGTVERISRGGTVVLLEPTGPTVTCAAAAMIDGVPLFALGRSDRTIEVWTESAVLLHAFEVSGKKSASLIRLGLVRGRSSAVAVIAPHSVRVWDFESGAYLYQLPRIPSVAVTALRLFTYGDSEVVFAGCSDGRIRTWRPGQDQYRVSRAHHGSAITEIGMLFPHSGAPEIATIGNDADLRLWPDMGENTVFPLPEKPRCLCAEGADLILSSGPALARFTARGLSRAESKSEARIDGFWSADSGLCLDDIAASKIPRALRSKEASDVGLAARLERGRARLADGSYEEAVSELLPVARHLPVAVSVAADSAWASDDSTLMRRLVAEIDVPGFRNRGFLQSRLFYLALAVGDGGAVARSSESIVSSMATSAAGAVSMIGGTPEREWSSYRRAADALHTQAVRADCPWAAYLPVAVAIRVKAVASAWSKGDTDRFARIEAELIEEFWQWFDDDVERVLHDVLLGFADLSAKRSHHRAHEVLSMLDVLRAISPGHDALADNLRDALVTRLMRASFEERSDFFYWVPFSRLAGEVSPRVWTDPAPSRQD